MALAAFAGYHKKLRFATDAQLMCPSCSLPKGLNVSTVQQLGHVLEHYVPVKFVVHTLAIL